MKLAYVEVEGDRGFAIRSRNGWMTYRSLGLDAEDTEAAIGLFDEAVKRRETSDIAGHREVSLLSPVRRPGKILAVALNYLAHIEETEGNRPERPIIFAKYSSSLCGPFDDIVMDPRITEKGDYESELAVVIGRAARWVSEEDALDHVFGYTVANDVSARDWQSIDSQFSRSKSYDTFCPVGPWITTSDEVSDPQALRVSSTVNGKLRQDSSTALMIFGVAYLISYLSRTTTLMPGDVILTGTPHGVGMGMKPPVYLVPGDRVSCEVEGLGSIDNAVVAPAG